MAPRKTAAERAAEEAAKQEAESVTTEPAADVDPTPEPTPDPDDVVDQEWADAVARADIDDLRFDPDRLGAPEPYVAKKWPHAARPQIVRQLFEAAEELGYPADSVRSTSDGFKYPENLDRYLYPSEYQ